MGKLKGYKTYLVAGVAMIGAAAGYLAGDLDAATASQRVLEALMFVFLRSGIKS